MPRLQPMLVHTHTRTHSHHSAVTQTRGRASDYQTNVTNMHSQERLTNSRPWVGAFPRPAEWSGHRGATRAQISVSTGCALAVGGPHGRLDKGAIAMEQANTWQSELHQLRDNTLLFFRLFPPFSYSFRQSHAQVSLLLLSSKSEIDTRRR